ncbi:uncharacterized protein LOC116106512 [Pistacia vera]|uniref:uncharacterized protein LOC116106512 n=1 Tax=Pistacia vera TaxID=55513 RepID=UPI001262B3BB|nr:uncharacterized protein LOC116106512 [Pistacia vera]XP_031248743.1 uncharacterized protein LOC116106512 [Pistacia vera]
MEEVRVLVRFGGKWETSAGGRYAYNGGRLKGMKVTKHVAYKDFVEELYQTIEVDANEYDLKMEVLWRSTSMPIPPMEISNDNDLCFFLDGVVGPDDDFIPLCITLVPKASILPVVRSPVHQISNCYTHFVSGSGSNQIGSITCSPNEPEVETNPSYVPVKTLEEELPFSQPQMSEPTLSQQQTLVKNDAAHNTQGNAHQVDGTGTNTVDGNAMMDDKGVLEGTKKGNQVKDNAPVKSVNGLHQNLQNAMPSKRFSYLPYLPECDATSLSDDDDALLVGKTFSSKKELQKNLGLHAVKNHYQFKVNKSSTKRFEALCINKNCKWRARAVKLAESDAFELRRLDQNHSCATRQATNHSYETQQPSVRHRQATSWFIGDYVKERLQEKQYNYNTKEIREDIRTDFGIELSYTTCSRARASAIKQMKESLENSNEVFPSIDEKLGQKKHELSSKAQKMCGRCGIYGHNRKSCKNPVPPQPSCEGKS